VSVLPIPLPRPLSRPLPPRPRPPPRPPRSDGNPSVEIAADSFSFSSLSFSSNSDDFDSEGFHLQTNKQQKQIRDCKTKRQIQTGDNNTLLDDI